jgi:hypothetical protein
MASENKKKKLKNSNWVASGLKNKKKGIKRVHFYTASQRKENKKIE